MVTAALYGLLASSGFIAGVVIGLFTSPSRRLVAAVVAFGSGILVSALTFELMEEAFETGSVSFVLAGFSLVRSSTLLSMHCLSGWLPVHQSAKVGTHKT